jgi:hypothetical protein
LNAQCEAAGDGSARTMILNLFSFI